MILGDLTLRRLCSDRKMINPFHERTRYNGLTFGLSSAGYDVRIDRAVTLKSGQFALAATVEHFDMPLNVVGIVHDKSTWARQGLAVQNTVIEPGWRGYLTLELTNHSDTSIFIDDSTPIAQIIFHLVDQNTVGYEGKYQDQEAGPQPARFD